MATIDVCLVDLIYVTLACKDANSKLVEVVTVANIDDKDRIGNSLSTLATLVTHSLPH